MTQVNNVNVVVETPAAQDRLFFLDGLRGWAALMVVLSHLLVFFVSHTSLTYQGWYWAFPTDGNLAVFIFFVLSGFALSIGYIQTSRMSLLTALCARRYLRLAIPILCASLFAYLLLAARLFYNIDAGKAIGNNWLTNFYGFAPDLYESLKFGLYDVFMSGDAARSYNPILWTMPIELFGSFIVFAICALFLYLKKRLFFIAAILLYFVLSKNNYYLSFVAGMCIALCYHHREKAVFRKIHFALPLLLIGAVYYSSISLRGRGLAVPQIVRADFLSILAASAMVFAAAFYRPFRRFLENPVSRYLGSISFPIYLTHFIVICTFSSGFLLYLRGTAQGYTETNVQMNVAASLLVCFVIAHLFRHVETLAIFVARRFSEYMQK
ncbi:acyltransferase family protein [Noviherbaspirillum sedimenti]|uniref:Acyltransferase n=1 Tax=Noviherbaspirillum sedimenti TaxID=2320865 RepID=A0A3A3FXC5_9BURK|nr:acyltransferase [Noviherbaspirillum sedimenti]RJG00374.1 acyltransferase [Noviherbaspirillum sedimenti]